MPFVVVHPDERNPQPPRQRLAVGYAGQERADQARARGDRDAREIAQFRARIGQCLVHHGYDRAGVRPAGEFRDDPAKDAVHILGQDAEPAQSSSAAVQSKDGGRGFIAAGFDAENQLRHRAA